MDRKSQYFDPNCPCCVNSRQDYKNLQLRLHQSKNIIKSLHQEISTLKLEIENNDFVSKSDVEEIAKDRSREMIFSYLIALDGLMSVLPFRMLQKPEVKSAIQKIKDLAGDYKLKWIDFDWDLQKQDKFTQSRGEVA